MGASCARVIVHVWNGRVLTESTTQEVKWLMEGGLSGSKRASCRVEKGAVILSSGGPRRSLGGFMAEREGEKGSACLFGNHLPRQGCAGDLPCQRSWGAQV